MRIRHTYQCPRCDVIFMAVFGLHQCWVCGRFAPRRSPLVVTGGHTVTWRYIPQAAAA